MTSRRALRLPSSPLFCPDEGWSRRLNCRPPSPVLKPASSSARCNCGASCCSMVSVSGFSTVRCDVTWPVRSTSMRTSMRPRSAGSSRISKLLLPFFTEVAISIASPLSGAGALVATVTLSGPVGASVAAAGGSCGCIVTVGWMPVSDVSVDACVLGVAAAWSWIVTVAAGVGTASVGLLPAASLLPACLPVVAGCGAALVVAVPVAVAALVGSDLPELEPVAPLVVFAEPVDGVVSCVAFGATGAVVATVALDAVSVAGCVPACLADGVVSPAAACVAALAVAAAFAVTAAAALVSVLIWTEPATAGPVTGALAAMAAAAIASGGVAPPGVGVAAAAEESVATFGTAIATATAFAAGAGVAAG